MPFVPLANREAAAHPGPRHLTILENLGNYETNSLTPGTAPKSEFGLGVGPEMSTKLA
jgi:hypothetical protein